MISYLILKLKRGDDNRTGAGQKRETRAKRLGYEKAWEHRGGTSKCVQGGQTHIDTSPRIADDSSDITIPIAHCLAIDRDCSNIIDEGHTIEDLADDDPTVIGCSILSQREMEFESAAALSHANKALAVVYEGILVGIQGCGDGDRLTLRSAGLLVEGVVLLDGAQFDVGMGDDFGGLGIAVAGCAAAFVM